MTVFYPHSQASKQADADDDIVTVSCTHRRVSKQAGAREDMVFIGTVSVALTASF